MPPDLPPDVLGGSVALGAGLLIGLERERRKGRGAGRQAAGIRSFTLAALAGALAQGLQQPTLVALAGAVIVVLSALAYWRSPRNDPGLTTELALFVTFLIGVLAMRQPAWGAGAAAIVAGLLAARERLHRFATRAMSEGELHDALLLAALVLVVLPLTPAEPIAGLGGLVPRTLVLLAVLILALQGAGHVAGRWLGPRAGPLLAGLLSGFVSSTATVASMGTRVRAEPARRAAWEGGAMMSTAATWVQVVVMLLAVAPTLALRVAPAAAAGAGVAALTGLWRGRQSPPDAPSPAGPRPRVPAPDRAGPLRVRAALIVALLLVGVALLVRGAQALMGDTGVLAGAALGALADAHAAVASLGTLQTSGRIDSALALGGVLMAVATNSVTRVVAAGVAGGAAYARRVGLSLLASGAAAGAVMALLPGAAP
ncbi:DUF4010 domain-containing protein [Rubrivivax albus]|uniref:DUF4010 domain-containing protein n=1 Tax=Rubrivivax albus TaxID=2499835 RepID=A0A3S2UNH5_9BURK|nr:DUF4010 domain-containing protein [Rubrivivax albus]RVT50005.1 DUF4010 domain-containing protein [Rubrivivax albus]